MGASLSVIRTKASSWTPAPSASFPAASWDCRSDASTDAGCDDPHVTTPAARDTSTATIDRQSHGAGGVTGEPALHRRQARTIPRPGIPGEAGADRRTTRNVLRKRKSLRNGVRGRGVAAFVGVGVATGNCRTFAPDHGESGCANARSSRRCAGRGPGRPAQPGRLLTGE